MATWRRRAIEDFPDLRVALNDPGYTIYRLFFDLLPAVRTAHREADDVRLTTIYGYATWCARQRSKDLWNAAGVAFYEHLFDEPWMSPSVPPWLPGDIRASHLGLWRARLSVRDFATVTELLTAIPPETE
jgi:hypothetical protein